MAGGTVINVSINITTIILPVSSHSLPLREKQPLLMERSIFGSRQLWTGFSALHLLPSTFLVGEKNFSQPLLYQSQTKITPQLSGEETGKDLFQPIAIFISGVRSDCLYLFLPLESLSPVCI